MAIPKVRDRIKHFRKVQRFQEIFGKREEQKAEKPKESEEEKKAKEDKILQLFKMKREKKSE